MRRLGVLFGASVAALLVFAQCGEDEKAGCRQACTVAQECGLLPSPLGARTYTVEAFDNCVARCSLTDDVLRSTITRCLDRPLGGGSRKVQWCDSLGACSRAASCLRTAPGGSTLLGSAAMTISATATGDANLGPPASCAERACTAEQCSGLPDASSCSRESCTEALSESAADLWCKAVGASTGRAVVEQFGAWHPGESLPCVEVLAHPDLIEGITPGMVQPLVEIRGEFPIDACADAAPMMQPYCLPLYGARTFITAGATDRAQITMLSPARFADELGPRCESDPDSCSDGIDNDGDDAVDCADVSCAAFCSVPARSCDGGACSDASADAALDAPPDSTTED